LLKILSKFFNIFTLADRLLENFYKEAPMTEETRRAAVYLGTHCNIGLKRAFPSGVLDRWHNCLLIYWHNVAQRATPTSVCLLLHHDSAKRRRQWSSKFVLFVRL